jgi:hypothetical protein
MLTTPYQAPVLFGTRRTPPPNLPIPLLTGLRSTAATRPCPTLTALLLRRAGGAP